MTELLVVGFKKDMYRASEALNMLQEMNNSWIVDLNDAVAVYRDYSGKLRVDQSYQLTTGEGAAWGGLFGGLIGALLAAPFTGGASAAAALTAGSLSGVALGATIGAIDASTWKDTYGIYFRGLRAADQRAGSARRLGSVRSRTRRQSRFARRRVQRLRRHGASHHAQ
jgi:uncharacterized membrane protein